MFNAERAAEASPAATMLRTVPAGLNDADLQDAYMSFCRKYRTLILLPGGRRAA